MVESSYENSEGGTTYLSERLYYDVREITIPDLSNRFLETISNLGDTVDEPNLQDSIRLLLKIEVNPLHKIFVAVKDDGEVIETTTLLVEQKFIHNCGLAGHIEYVAVGEAYEGRGVGRALVKLAVEAAARPGCYKCILDCTDRVSGFYEKITFRRHETRMRKDLP